MHLEDDHQVVFEKTTEIQALDFQRETELTAFFKLNKEIKSRPHKLNEFVKYKDLPKTYTYTPKTKAWTIRKGSFQTIARVHPINPIAGDVFYLRMLLHNDHCKQKEGFADMLTVNSTVCETYKEVCRELGLLSEDREWEQVLEEGSSLKCSKQLRELYITIVIFCEPSNPFLLFDKFWSDWYDDYKFKFQKRGVYLEDEQLKTLVLSDLQARLQSFGKSLIEYQLPVPSVEELAKIEEEVQEEAVIREEKEYNIEELKERIQGIHFTNEQQDVFDTIIQAVTLMVPLLMFIDARGGCGKTFLLNAVLDAVRSSQPGGCVALAMATTGIAANLLNLGRTYHSRLKAELENTPESTLRITGQSPLAKLVRIAKLLMIDESTMLHKYQLEALDRSLRDLMCTPNLPFGGKIIILAGKILLNYKS